MHSSESSAWRWRDVTVALAIVIGCPSFALAQAGASITGIVRDGSGAVLPGVTVEASSPALIEQQRTVVTDQGGQYRIEALRPGTYTVTFTLTGFNTFRREELVLTGTFVATVNAELGVGSLNETVTVSGESPVVDLQSARQQRVFSQEVLDAIPQGRTPVPGKELVDGPAAKAAVRVVEEQRPAHSSDRRARGVHPGSVIRVNRSRIPRIIARAVSGGTKAR